MVIELILTYDNMVSLKKLTEIIIQEKYKTYPPCVLRAPSIDEKFELIKRIYESIDKNPDNRNTDTKIVSIDVTEKDYKNIEGEIRIQRNVLRVLKNAGIYSDYETKQTEGIINLLSYFCQIYELTKNTKDKQFKKYIKNQYINFQPYSFPKCYSNDTSKKVFLIQRFKYDAIGTEFNTAPRITLTETDAWNWVENDIYSHFDAYDLKIEEYNPCRYSIKISHPLDKIHSIRVCILDQTIRYTIQEIEPLKNVDRYIYN